MFNFPNSEMAKINRIIEDGGNSVFSDKQIIELEIKKFKASGKRAEMLEGERYYNGLHDILKKRRTAIGKGGELIEVQNLPNSRIVDNQYRKMVKQKVNYLLGQPITFRTDNEQYADCLKEVFNKKFLRLMHSLGKDVLNGGIGWLFPFYNEQGEFTFRKFKPFELLPFWEDSEHTLLSGAVRIYKVASVDKNGDEKEIEKVEVYDENGVSYFYLSDNGELIPEKPFFKAYLTVTGEDGKENGYNWAKIPLISIKRDEEETPLIRGVKSLQDALNTIKSNFQNAMEEDTRNTIIVLVNYDGADLGEFRQNLATYSAVKVRNIDGKGGDVRTLQIEVNSDNYKAIIELLKKAIIENAMGYDAKDDRLSGNPNQMNIQSMYSDIDLDANETETELQAAFENLLWFVNCHLANTGKGNFEGEDVEVIFNRDMLINETEVISNCINSQGVLSDETITANHPWVDDIKKELDKKEAEKAKAQAEADSYRTAFEGINTANREQNT